MTEVEQELENEILAIEERLRKHQTGEEPIDPETHRQILQDYAFALDTERARRRA